MVAKISMFCECVALTFYKWSKELFPDIAALSSYLQFLCSQWDFPISVAILPPLWGPVTKIINSQREKHKRHLCLGSRHFEVQTNCSHESSPTGRPN